MTQTDLLCIHGDPSNKDQPRIPFPPVITPPAKEAKALLSLPGKGTLEMSAAEAQVEVRREDQTAINQFSALNRRMKELESDTDDLKVRALRIVL